MKPIPKILMVSLLVCAGVYAAETSKPNIVYILADDLGYGDVQCLNPERGKIKTPHLDKMAAGGMIFTEAHSSSSVCTPTRYGILTGRYNWRTKLQSGVLGGYSPPLIDKGRLTVPGFLKQQGYHTACIGKWHLGMDIGQNDPTAPIAEGPTTRGFDSFFGISASLDMPPYAYIENDHFTEAPTAVKKWMRSGAAAPGFEAIDVLPMLTRKAIEFIGQRAKAEKPFFLYLPLPSPHTPILPTEEWQGKSGLNSYADFVMQTDSTVGQVMAALEKSGITNNTLVIFTSDNGCSPQADFDELESKGHFPSELRRGHKADLLDGGHRVPFIVQWPDKVKAGSKTDQLTCLTDLMATSAEIVGSKLPDNVGEDSVSILPALLGSAAGPLREAVVHHSIRGNFAIRKGKWKLLFCKDSGGWTKGFHVETPAQLYDMTKDISERTNEYTDQAETVAQLTALLETYIADGRSTPGSSLKNDVPIDILKVKAPNPKNRK
jgi:arylsulfatase A